MSYLGPGTTYALKFLAFGITPLDSEHAECYCNVADKMNGIIMRSHLIIMTSF